MLTSCKGNLSRENFSCYVALIKPRFHRSSGVFFYMWEIPLTLVFTFLYLSLAIYLSLCDCKFVFSLLSTGCVIAYVNVARKRELSQKPNLCCGGHYLYVNKSLQKICCLFFKALSIMKVFSLTIHNST